MCRSCEQGGPQIAAVWTRVSTSGQMDLSPETQVSEVKPWLEEQGYAVPEDRIIKVHWTSQEVLDCPAMRDKLLPWVRSGEIHAVGVIHDDRLAGTPGSKVIILDACEKHGVKVLSKHNPIPEGWVGELVAYLNAVNKRNTVTELRTRVKGGMRDRAAIKGLPTTGGRVTYGYRLRYELKDGKKTPVAFEPDPQTYSVACRIWRMALDGTPTRRICSTLVADGIPAPRGGKAWGSNTVYTMLTNPIYGGKYFALRQESREPGFRLKPDKTYGRSSHAKVPRDQWLELDFPVISPIVSWTEWEAVQRRLTLNKLESKRNAKRVYMLRGMLVCPEDGRRLIGRGGNRRPDYYYVCSKRYRQDGHPAVRVPAGLRSHGRAAGLGERIGVSQRPPHLPGRTGAQTRQQ